MNPPLFSSRTPAQQVLLANVVPAVFGLVVGVFAGISAPIYLLLSLLALAGAYFAGLEHRFAKEGLIRGAAAGLLFGVFLLLGRAITGLDDKADVPPGIVLVFITTTVGAIGGALGATRRRKREDREREDRERDATEANSAPVGGV
jgi:hypothetical protein